MLQHFPVQHRTRAQLLMHRDGEWAGSYTAVLEHSDRFIQHKDTSIHRPVQ